MKSVANFFGIGRVARWANMEQLPVPYAGDLVKLEYRGSFATMMTYVENCGLISLEKERKAEEIKWFVENVQNKYHTLRKMPTSYASRVTSDFRYFNLSRLTGTAKPRIMLVEFTDQLLKSFLATVLFEGDQQALNQLLEVWIEKLQLLRLFFRNAVREPYDEPLHFHGPFKLFAGAFLTDAKEAASVDSKALILIEGDAPLGDSFTFENGVTARGAADAGCHSGNAQLCKSVQELKEAYADAQGRKVDYDSENNTFRPQFSKLFKSRSDFGSYSDRMWPMIAGSPGSSRVFLRI